MIVPKPYIELKSSGRRIPSLLFWAFLLLACVGVMVASKFDALGSYVTFACMVIALMECARFARSEDQAHVGQNPQSPHHPH